jgi:two-component system, chemotaxis family, protein-glutamate methylesterase/glutaminase
VTPRYGIIAIGTSWGGLAALRELMAALPADMSIPIVVIQHRHRQSDRLLATLLQDRTRLRVCEVEDKAPVEAGAVYLAPADYHLLVDHDSFSLSTEAPVRYSRPSIDVAFESIADSYGARAVGVVLTGANADGARGLRRIQERGGLAIVQEPTTAESPTMPAAALREVPTARSLTLAGLAVLLGRLSRGMEALP